MSAIMPKSAFEKIVCAAKAHVESLCPQDQGNVVCLSSRAQAKFSGFISELLEVVRFSGKTEGAESFVALHQQIEGCFSRFLDKQGKNCVLDVQSNLSHFRGLTNTLLLEVVQKISLQNPEMKLPMVQFLLDHTAVSESQLKPYAVEQKQFALRLMEEKKPALVPSFMPNSPC